MSFKEKFQEMAFGDLNTPQRSSAIVTGATGILGSEIVTRLAKNSNQWSTIYAFSRSKKDTYPSNVKHAHIDLLASADEMAGLIEGVEAEYLFFAAYLAKDSEEEATRVNGDMLQSFLHALELTGAARRLKRIVLVTGCKQYGVHLGRPKNPMQETDSWLRDECFPPNFYYRQQDILHDFCATSMEGRVKWTVTYPNDVIGFAKGNFMNLATSVALYAAVSKEMGQDLVFPGSERFYGGFDCFTAADLHAEFCEWAALSDKAANQAFNVVNGDVESWQNLWPRLAKRFGMRVKPNQFTAQPGEESSSSDLNPVSPISIFEKEMGLEGAAVPSKLEQKVDLVKWSQRENVRKAWDTLAEREGLDKTAFGEATWGFLGFVLGRAFDLVISMSKARAAGWTGYRDTWSSFSDVFNLLEQEKIVPGRN